jgi:hypothetical protein
VFEVRLDLQDETAKSEAEVVLIDFIESSDSLHITPCKVLFASNFRSWREPRLQQFRGISRGKRYSFTKQGRARTPNYNDQERQNRTLGEKQRALLKDANLPDIFWTFARDTAKH